MRTVTHIDLVPASERRRLQVREWLAECLDSPRLADRVYSVTFLPFGWMVVRTVLCDRGGTPILHRDAPAVQRQCVRVVRPVPFAVREILRGGR